MGRKGEGEDLGRKKGEDLEGGLPFSKPLLWLSHKLLPRRRITLLSPLSIFKKIE